MAAAPCRRPALAASACPYTAGHPSRRTDAVDPTVPPPASDRPPADAAPEPPAPLAQAVQCGPWALAFPFSWARSIVEEFELTEVPHAPAWLLGAANVDGKVVPVIDLARYLDPQAPGVPDAERRLLVGGAGEDAAGFVFSGRPVLVRPLPRLPAPGVPAALAEFVTGAAAGDDGRGWALVDAPALLEALSAELALA